MAIETERGPSGKPVTRARINGTATACHYPRSQRIVIVADGGNFADAIAALEELRAAVEGGEYLGCLDCGGHTWSAGQ